MKAASRQIRPLLPYGTVLVLAACATGETLDAPSGDGFDAGTNHGGTANAGGFTSSTGGAANGGADANTSGAQVGGAAGSGGASNAGGASGSAGASNAGGASGSAGASNAGGATSAGGAQNGGGAATAGGATSAGGSPGSGGAANAGGATQTGGSANTGGASGCANQDGDRLTDCEEDADDILSTSKTVWNGLTASLVGSGGGNCTEICLASQIANLFGSPLETHAIYSGWDFDTDQPENQSPSSPTFGFQPPFASTITGWRMLYRGLFWVPPTATGQYCFNVDIGSDGGSGTNDTSPDACGAIYLPDVQANAWVMNGRHQTSTSDSPPMPSESKQQTKCTTFATAGGKRIDFVYQYSGNNADNRHQLHVKYCYGSASPCTPTTPIDDTVLTQVGATIP
ncbi:MAG TPA: hypothetical protein VHE30_21860 [Polyangiaceae bacterium]|nr:hypothetical protein [Polyangiaceae bacterium]